MQQYLLTNVDSKTDWCSFVIEMLTLFASVAMAIIAWWAFNYTRKEYDSHLAKEKANVLSHYNERYSSDENIAKVVRYLLKKEEEKEKSESKEKEQVAESQQIVESKQTEPTTFEKEMFLRFFEELQYAIEKKSIDEKMAYDMFAHYAIEAYDEGETFIKDLNTKDWRRFLIFAERMKKIQQREEKCNKNESRK